MTRSMAKERTRRPPSVGAPGRIAIAAVSVLVVASAALTTAFLGGPAAGALPRSAADIESMLAGDVAVLAVLAVRVVAVVLALWWIGLMAAVWLAGWRGRSDRITHYARLLPAPLRLAVTLSLSPVLISLPASLAGAQERPPTGVPTSLTTPSETSTSSNLNPAGVLELTPLPTGVTRQRASPGAPTVGTSPAPSAPQGLGGPAGGDSPGPGPGGPADLASGDEADLASGEAAVCPTIVTRSDVHWFDQARDFLNDQLGRSSSDDEAEAYWARCVDHNAARLTDPAEPDVVRPGQVLELPELPRTL